MLKNLMARSQKSEIKTITKEFEKDVGRIDVRVQTTEDDFFKHRFLGNVVKNDNSVNFIYASDLYENFLYQLNNEKSSNFIMLKNDDNKTEVAIRIENIRKIVDVQRIKNVVKYTIEEEEGNG